MADDAHGTDATTFAPVRTPGDAQPRLEDGNVIGGRWRLEEFLKRGGMGRGWRASDLRLCEPISIKLVDPAIVETETARARSLREAREALPPAARSNFHRVGDTPETIRETR